MESKNEFKKINIKNRTCYYFDDIMKVEDIKVNNILLDEKSYENILVYNILYKRFMDAKPLHQGLTIGVCRVHTYAYFY